jgi:hypothetical protein
MGRVHSSQPALRSWPKATSPDDPGGQKVTTEKVTTNLRCSSMIDSGILFSFNKQLIKKQRSLVIRGDLF